VQSFRKRIDTKSRWHLQIPKVADIYRYQTSLTFTDTKSRWHLQIPKVGDIYSYQKPLTFTVTKSRWHLQIQKVADIYRCQKSLTFTDAKSRWHYRCQNSLTFTDAKSRWHLQMPTRLKKRIKKITFYVVMRYRNNLNRDTVLLSEFGRHLYCLYNGPSLNQLCRDPPHDLIALIMSKNRPKYLLH
jgi:hypothetical protein